MQSYINDHFALSPFSTSLNTLCVVLFFGKLGKGMAQTDSSDKNYVYQLGLWSAIAATILVIIAGITATASIPALCNNHGFSINPIFSCSYGLYSRLRIRKQESFQPCRALIYDNLRDSD